MTPADVVNVVLKALEAYFCASATWFAMFVPAFAACVALAAAAIALFDAAAACVVAVVALAAAAAACVVAVVACPCNTVLLFVVMSSTCCLLTPSVADIPATTFVIRLLPTFKLPLMVTLVSVPPRFCTASFSSCNENIVCSALSFKSAAFTDEPAVNVTLGELTSVLLAIRMITGFAGMLPAVKTTVPPPLGV